MSMHTQLMRGLMALPVALLLLLAAAVSPDTTRATAATSDCATAESAPATLPRTVEFRSMLPGALNIARRVKIIEG
jgi:hypothetical protein